MRSCSRKRERAASMSTSSAIQSRAAGARPTIQIFWRTGVRISSAGMRATSAGAPMGRSISSGASSTVSSTSVNPKVIVIQAGTNNIGAQPGGAGKVAEITRGLTAILDICRQKAPRATVILTALFPRNDNMAVMPDIDQVNANLARLADGRNVRYLSVNDTLADKDGRLFGRHDERARQAASHAAGLSGVGGRSQTDPHGPAGTARLDRPRPCADWRPERATAVAIGASAPPPPPPIRNRASLPVHPEFPGPLGRPLWSGGGNSNRLCQGFGAPSLRPLGPEPSAVRAIFE